MQVWHLIAIYSVLTAVGASVTLYRLRHKWPKHGGHTHRSYFFQAGRIRFGKRCT